MKIFKSKKAEFNIKSTYDALIEEWNVNVKQVNVPTEYGTTHVNVCGQPNGIPLVMLHGVGDNSALMWIYNAAALAQHFKIYAIDTIGGPGKSIPSEKYNKNFDPVRWLDDVLNFFELSDVNLVGVSHGGYLAQYYTSKRSNRVIKAACLASTVSVKESQSPIKIMLKIFFPEALIPTKNNIKKLLKKLSGENSDAFINHPLIFEHFVYLTKGFNNMAMKHHKIIPFTEEQLNVIRDKCLFLVGE